MLSSLKLVVVSSVIHYRYEGRLFAYGPYVRELDLWSQLFASVVVAAPCRNSEPPKDCLAFSSASISVRPITRTGGDEFGDKLKQLVILPTVVLELCRVLYTADAIHVRCPGNLGLLGALLAPLFSTKRIAKYAGDWRGFPEEARTTALQRLILRSRWWNAPVTVYGSYPGKPTHVIPFFTSILDDSQMDRARAVASARVSVARAPLHVLYVGRLSKAKNVDVLIQAVAVLRTEGTPVLCTIIGEGPETARLRDAAASYDVADIVHFLGGLDHASVLAHYECADVLVHASESEGWPKAIAEAMAFGVICIGSDRGLVVRMLSNGRGLTVKPRDVRSLAARLREVALNPEAFVGMRVNACKWSQQFSLSGLRDSLRQLLETEWGISPTRRLPAPSQIVNQRSALGEM